MAQGLRFDVDERTLPIGRIGAVVICRLDALCVRRVLARAPVAADAAVLLASGALGAASTAADAAAFGAAALDGGAAIGDAGGAKRVEAGDAYAAA